MRQEQNRKLQAEGLKLCSRCLEIKPLEAFSPYGRKSPGAYYSQCRACTNKRINKANQQKALTKQANYTQACKLCDRPIEALRSTQGYCCKQHRLFVWQATQYKASLEAARRLFNLSECQTCGSTENLCIDHSHKTGKWRGRLCQNCNTALGHFFENTKSIENAIAYLDKDIELPVLAEVKDRSQCRWCEKPLVGAYPNRKFCSNNCKHRAGDISEKYGLTVEQYKWLLASQGHRCACCEQDLDQVKAVVDHCHDQGHARGILCWHCNLALGHSRDNKVILNNFIDYLERAQTQWDDWHVMEIDNQLARKTAIEKHYLHRAPNVSFGFGLFYREELKGICTFGSPSSMRITNSVCPTQPKSVVELNRLWLSDDCPDFSESWFVSRCLKKLPARIVISYADTGVTDTLHNRQHDGTIYKALNFHYAGKSKASVDWRLEGRTRNVGRHVEGAVAVPVSPKNRFWCLTGTKREKKLLRALCYWPSEQTGPHPKPHQSKAL